MLQVAQTALRSVIGRADLDTLLSGRERVNAELKAVIDAPTEKPWGVLIERVEVKDVAPPDSMKRSMSRQAEAEKNSTLVIPFPVEPLRFFDRATHGAAVATAAIPPSLEELGATVSDPVGVFPR